MVTPTTQAGAFAVVLALACLMPVCQRSYFESSRRTVS